MPNPNSLTRTFVAVALGLALTISPLSAQPAPGAPPPPPGALEEAAGGRFSAPSKDEIETRIKSIADEKGFSTYTDANGRLQMKDADGNNVALPPEVFSPSGDMPSKETIENRIKTWADKMGLSTSTDDKSGRLIVTNGSDTVPLPPSIFFPEKDDDEDATNDDTASATTDLTASEDVSLTSVEDTLSTDE